MTVGMKEALVAVRSVNSWKGMRQRGTSVHVGTQMQDGVMNEAVRRSIKAGWFKNIPVMSAMTLRFLYGVSR